MSDSLAGPGDSDSLAEPGDMDSHGATAGPTATTAASLVSWQADLCIIITRYSVNVPPDCRCVIAVREFLLAFDQRMS